MGLHNTSGTHGVASFNSFSAANAYHGDKLVHVVAISMYDQGDYLGQSPSSTLVEAGDVLMEEGVNSLTSNVCVHARSTEPGGMALDAHLLQASLKSGLVHVIWL